MTAKLYRRCFGSPLVSLIANWVEARCRSGRVLALRRGPIVLKASFGESWRRREKEDGGYQPGVAASGRGEVGVGENRLRRGAAQTDSVVWG
jgi:hypothetical protein